MESVFMNVLNMSMSVTMVFIVVVSIRQILKNRLPRLFSYVLWSILLIRLIIPFFPSTSLSILNYIPSPPATRVMEMDGSVSILKYIPDNIELMKTPKVETGFKVIDKEINKILPPATPASSANPMQIIMFLASVVWLFGIIAMLLCLTFLHIKTMRRLKTVAVYKDDEIIGYFSKKVGPIKNINIYMSDKITKPMVYGFINPRIVLPANYKDNTGLLKHTILHGIIHIKRLDHIIRPLLWLVLSIHWFNPLVWLSFILAQKDMEVSNDEKVMSIIEKDIRSEYANSISSIGGNQKTLFNGGLFFINEGNIKARIKGIMDYKKPSLLVNLVSVIVFVMLAISLLGNPMDDGLNLSFVNEEDDFRNAFRHLDQVDYLKVNEKYELSYLVDFVKLLEVNKWKKEGPGSSPVLVSDIQLDVNGNVSIRLFETKPLAIVIYNDESRLYKIPYGVYKNTEEYIIRHRPRKYEGPVKTHIPIEISIEEILDKYIPKMINTKVKENSMEFVGKRKMNVISELITVLEEEGWEELKDEQLGSKMFFEKEIDGQLIKISISAFEKKGTKEENIITIVTFQLW